MLKQTLYTIFNSSILVCNKASREMHVTKILRVKFYTKTYLDHRNKVLPQRMTCMHKRWESSFTNSCFRPYTLLEMWI